VLRYGKRSGGLAAVAVLSLLVFASSPAAADPVLDANCPDPDDGSVSFINPPGGNGRTAQTFTVINTGSLTSAQMEVIKAMGSTGDYILQIVAVDGSGVPTNTVLASATIPNDTVPTGESTITGNFATPVAVTAGQQYAVLVTRPSSTNLNVSARFGDDCPGARFSSASQTGAFTEDPGTDHIFAVFVEPTPPPQPEPQPTAQQTGRTLTLDANKNKVKKGKRVTLTGQVNQVARQGACESNQTVQLQRKKPSQTAFATVEQVQTTATGSFSAKEKVKKTFQYRAQVTETSTCGGALSNTEKVKVKKKR
jgi:hypothetical protein